MKNSIDRQPNAKINLGLLIKGKRPDGYHLLETLYYPIPDLADFLSITPVDRSGCQLQIEGMQLDGDPADNLCVKAYDALSEAVGDLPGIKILLQKQIPAGAGLGGGSSDAASTLSALNELFSLNRSDDELAAIGAKLGADVPFFLYNRPLLASGIGTDFEEITLDLPYRIKLIRPGIHSSTIAAYKALDYRMFDPKRDLKAILQGAIANWPEQLENDLEVPVFEMYPELKQIKADLYAQGAIYAAMSGSGSAMFGLFPV